MRRSSSVCGRECSVCHATLVGYRFYQGAPGHTATLLQDSTTSYKTVKPPSLPMRYWVRVYYSSNPTRCFANAELIVQ